MIIVIVILKSSQKRSRFLEHSSSWRHVNDSACAVCQWSLESRRSSNWSSDSRNRTLSAPLSLFVSWGGWGKEKKTRKRAGKDEKRKRATEEALAFSIFPSSTARLLFLTIFISIFNGILSRSLCEGERYTCDLNVGRTDQDLYVSVDFIPSLSQVLQLFQELSSLTH